MVGAPTPPSKVPLEMLDPAANSVRKRTNMGGTERGGEGSGMGVRGGEKRNERMEGWTKTMRQIELFVYLVCSVISHFANSNEFEEKLMQGQGAFNFGGTFSILAVCI